MNVRDIPSQLQANESARVQDQVLLESYRWKDEIILDLPDALKTGLFIELPDEDPELNYRLIGVLRRNEEPRAVRKSAYELFMQIMLMWKQQTHRSSEPSDNIFLPVTSLYRTEEIQQKLRQTSPFAAIGWSAHFAGAAIDIDPAGYYRGNEPINSKHPSFTSDYIHALIKILSEFEEEGRCHVIYETRYKSGSDGVFGTLACIHICSYPDRT